MKKHYCDFCGAEVEVDKNASTRFRECLPTYPDQRPALLTVKLEVLSVADSATRDKCMADYLESMVNYLRNGVVVLSNRLEG
jgi:hypothetical protein